MPRRDLLYAASVSILTTVFLFPTLINTGSLDKLPLSPILILAAYPLLATFGTFVAYFLGKRLAILWQFSKFALVGVCNTAIDFGILNLLILVTNITSGVRIIPLNITSYSIALLNSYFWNKRWVFSASKGSFLAFVAVTLVGLGINTGIVFALTTFADPMFGLDETLWANLAKVFATVISLVWNFMGYRIIVFGSSKKQAAVSS
ncbi:MAG: GtrA family protein [Candidatus Curtissbacteria bacterium]|nr:GtrA family protein [Candidatus Curtissbacteria bacterium]